MEQQSDLSSNENPSNDLCEGVAASAAQVIHLSGEQEAVLNHPLAYHARVLAGPGTGKSFTATLWLGQLHMRGTSSIRSKMLTFTRAATAEFASKLQDAGLGDAVETPATVHSHALSVLLGMSGHGLPEPIRIPDSWEASELIHKHLSRLLRQQGYTNATPGVIEKLEQEMAAGWEKLDEETVMLADVSPELRAAYVGVWGHHRTIFGYTLLAELPYRAGNALEDLGQDQPPKVNLLIVDEYQDLNAADIRFVAAHSQLGVAVVAIGDDDQSIYGWRFADPAGIRRFCDEFKPSCDYTLSLSRRCGRAIIAAANELIASAPDRPARPSLKSGDEVPDGLFAYVRFSNGHTEASGAAAIAAARVRAGVDPSKILVLVRSQEDRWRAALQSKFEAQGLELASGKWVDDALSDPTLRVIIALARLTDDEADSLAWWSFTEGLTPGIGPRFTDYIYDHRTPGERWSNALLRLRGDGFPGLAPNPASKAMGTVDAVLERLSRLPDELAAWSVDNADRPWSDWLLAEAADDIWRQTLKCDELSDEAAKLVAMVGPAVDRDAGVGGLLNQLEPVGRDLAVEEAGGVRLMTMSKSKGLTADTAIVMGVEEGVVPLGGADLDEERRLLYVAMTRAQKVCILTWASRRTGQLARSGGGQTQNQRRRSPLLEGLRCGRPVDGQNFMTNLSDIERI